MKEFAFCYERHPESVRTVPWLCPVGCDSVSAESAESTESEESADEFQIDSITSAKICGGSPLIRKNAVNSMQIGNRELQESSDTLLASPECKPYGFFFLEMLTVLHFRTPENPKCSK